MIINWIMPGDPFPTFDEVGLPKHKWTGHIMSETFTEKEVMSISAVKEQIKNLIDSRDIMAFNYYDSDKEVYDKNQANPGAVDLMVIAGGCIASLLQEQPINDIDVFLLDNANSLFQSLIAHKKGRWMVKYHLDDSDEYSNEHIYATAYNPESQIQYILTDYKTRQDLIKHFDFLHCTSSFHNGKLYINRPTYDAIINKNLIRQDRNKRAKQWRMQKFVSRGYNTEADQVLASTKTAAEILIESFHQKGPKIITTKEVDLESEMDALLDNLVVNTAP